LGHAQPNAQRRAKALGDLARRDIFDEAELEIASVEEHAVALVES